MPSTEAKERSKLGGVLDEFLFEKRVERGDDGDLYDPGFLNILEFVEKFKLLPNGLWPVQRFILKLYYNIKLDDVLPDDPAERIVIPKTFHRDDFVEMTEVQYLRYLYDQGRCNIAEQDSHKRHELVLVLGRRSGKSMLSGIISAYETYKLLRRGDPQAYYGMVPGSEIRLFCIANDKDQASIVYGEMQGHVAQVDYFSSSMVNDTQTYMRFRTEADGRRFRKDERKGTLVSSFKSSIAKGLRGRGCICCILDEIAFFIDDGKSSARKVYKAMSPALKQFSPKDPKNRRRPLGPSDGRMICISSPDAKDGLFYELYEMALAKSKGAQNMLMIQAPTWEVNPTMDSSEYEVERAKDPRGFETEYGAKFSDRVRGWIEDENDLLSCCIEGLKPLVRGTPRESFFAGLDFALSNDGTVVALTHIKDGRIQLAYHETWRAGERWKDLNPHLEEPIVPYARSIHDQARLDIDEIVLWLTALSKRFYILNGVFDQYAGVIFEQKLHKAGLMQFETKRFSTAESSNLYSTTKMLMFADQLGIYDYPVPEVMNTELNQRRHSPHVHELLELQATSGGKNILIVEAPRIEGKHDDFSDALVRSCFLAADYTRQNPHVLEGRIASLRPVQRRIAGGGYFQFHRQRARLHGGTPKERRVPFRRMR